MTARNRDELHPMATPEGLAHAEAVEAIPAAPVAAVESPRLHKCPKCKQGFPATALVGHLRDCGEEEVPNYFDEHDEARVRRTGTYEDRKAKENFRRFGDPKGPAKKEG